MKIAIIRGPSLNKFEMQYYEPLVKKHEVFCFASRQAIYDISSINLKTIKLPCYGQVFGKIPGATNLLYRLFGDPQGLIGLEKKISGFDIAHSAELFSYYTHQALLAKRKGKVKYVATTVSENIPFNQEWYPRQKILKRFALNHIDHILAISRKSKSMLTVEGYPPEKISVIPHGLDTNKFTPGRKDDSLARELGIERNDFVILSIGRLVWEKGFQDLMLATHNLVNSKKMENRNLKVLMLGKGPQHAKLNNLRNQLGLQEVVVFVSHQSYEKMPKIYNLADVFVLASIPTPTWQEQFGMVLLEAMSCGVAVISTRSGAISETVRDAGILVSANDYLDLASAIEELCLNQKRREDLGRIGRDRTLNFFSHQIIAEKIDQAYQNLLNKS